VRRGMIMTMKPEDVKPVADFVPVGYWLPAHEVGAIIKAIMSEKDLDTRLNWLAKADELEKMKRDINL
jgi:hypothetical protein